MGQMRRTDGQIQRDVINELRWDTRVKETDVGVEVHDGVVTLTGTVESWTARLAAKEAAHRVRGVLDVANDVKVKLPSEHDDTDIAKGVRAALEWDVLVPHESIRTTVSRGVVTLEGTVPYWSQHDDAGRCVRNLRGVTEVRNLITVQPPKVGTHTVKQAIADALDRHAAHTAKHVTVEVAGDKVVLSGEVPSWGERVAVEGAVKGTLGSGRSRAACECNPRLGPTSPPRIAKPAKRLP